MEAHTFIDNLFRQGDCGNPINAMIAFQINCNGLRSGGRQAAAWARHFFADMETNALRDIGSKRRGRMTR